MVGEALKDKIRNELIFKDATASGLQNYGILLGYKEDKLKYLNLDGEDWCDTYKYIIEKFLGGEGKKYSKRKYWKKTIMTIPYNSKWFSCFKKFLDSLEKDGIYYKNLTEEEKDKLKNLHINFYRDVKNKLKSEFYKEENKFITVIKYTKWKIVNTSEYKINWKNENGKYVRDKYVNTCYMLIDDEKATKTALEANSMHTLDAELVKKIITKFNIVPIHDCFGIKLKELHLVMDEINKYYWKKTKKETYSIHIII